MILDEHLDWTPQLDKLYPKLSGAAGMLSKLRYYFKYRTLISIYYALLNSHIDYCIHNLGFSKPPQKNLKKLKTKTLRIIHFIGPRESTRPLFEKSKILPVHELLNTAYLLLTFLKHFTQLFFKYLTHLGHHNQSTKATGHSLV